MQKLSRIAFRIFAILGLALSMSMVFHPSVKSAIRTVFVKEQRSILSTAKGLFNDAKDSFSFVKIKTREAIFIEVYRELDAKTEFVDRIELPKHKDAFFTFNGQTTNLAIDDIDGDQSPELLVPTFDSELVAHLSVFKFNASSNRFEPIDPSEINQ